ncbi:ribonuclease D [Wolbachia pipientis]|uniref:Ribonuclease D n=1 Tax=Wolbachia pipientis TaxID=955 RepID=A0A1E7QJ93_WOLPI|nr:ribonuclease D [Wolbachia pipientis]OEY86551.1 ribonuclease D [Wolbachia pipientis]
MTQQHLLINNTLDLEDVCGRLMAKKPDFIAVDTEFMRNNIIYYPKLSLIQISYGAESFIVDVLTPGMNLSAIEAIMLNKNIIKVFHSCRHDIESLLTLFQEIPSPIFDTQIAAMFCNYYYNFIGYSKLVEQYMGIEIDKITAKNSNWLKRPLSLEQLDYAINDVTYLYDLYQILCDQLEAKKRADWFQEEINVINDINRYTHNPREVWKKFHFNCEVTPMAIKAIVEWREILAQRYNINRNMIINNIVVNSLIDRSLERVDEILEYLKNNARNVNSEDLLEFIDIFYEHEQNISQYNNIPLYNYDKPVFDMLSIILDSKCRDNDISRKLVISKEDMAKSMSGCTDTLFKGWRYDFFGKSIKSFINNDSQFKISITKSSDNMMHLKSEESVL